MRLPLRRWPAHEERYSRSALVHARFSATHTGVVSLHACRAAVVGEEDHDGVIRELQRLQVREQTAHIVVEVLAHAVECGYVIVETLGFELVEVSVRHLKGRVRRVVGEVAEEGTGLIRCDELHRLIGQHVGDVALGLLWLRAAHEHRVEVVVPVPVVKPKRFVEPLAYRRERILLAVMPFPYVSGTISACVQRLRHRDLGRLHRLPIVRDTMATRTQRPATC